MSPSIYFQKPLKITRIHRKKEKEKCETREKRLLSLHLKPAVQARGYRKEEACAGEIFTFLS